MDSIYQAVIYNYDILKSFIAVYQWANARANQGRTSYGGEVGFFYLVGMGDKVLLEVHNPNSKNNKKCCLNSISNYFILLINLLFKFEFVDDLIVVSIPSYKYRG